MTYPNCLPRLRRVCFAAAFVLCQSDAFCQPSSKITFTPDASPADHAARKSDSPTRDFEPAFLAERLGVAERATKLQGAMVRDKAAHKNSKLLEMLVDLHSGRAVCTLVSLNATASVVPVPGRCFHCASGTAATLDIGDLNITKAPRIPGSADVGAILNSLPQSSAFFGQKFPLDVDASKIMRCKDVLGLKVKNKTGEDLGTLVNLMIDIPTSRITFAIVSLTRAETDLYAVPPAALTVAENQGSIVLNAAKLKIAQLAHSDEFFWCNMADENWGAAVYHTFGQEPDFAFKSSDPTREAVRGKVDEASPTVKAPPKGDVEIKREILTAMMHDDMDNPLIFKPVNISPSQGVVTLTGRLKSDKLRSKLDAIVASVVGAENVRDQIEVK